MTNEEKGEVEEKIQFEIPTNLLLEQGRCEIESIENLFEDVKTFINRAIATQWLLDQNGGGNFGLYGRIVEMIDDLAYYEAKLNDPGEESYDEFTREIFTEQLGIRFTSGPGE